MSLITPHLVGYHAALLCVLMHQYAYYNGYNFIQSFRYNIGNHVVIRLSLQVIVILKFRGISEYVPLKWKF